MHSIRRLLSPSPLSSSLLSLSRQPLRHSLSHTLTRSYTDDSSFHHVTSDQWDLIGKYEKELLEWNKKVNLISRKDAAVSGKVMTDHILPCLSISILRPFVPGETVLDAGTGNGLPGIPLAITHPYNDFTLVESSEKKAKIVQQMVTTLGLRNVTVINARAETLKDKFDFIVGRAVAPLPVYVKNIFRLCKKRSNVAMPNGRQGNSKHFGPGLLYIKGGDFDDELGLAGVRRFNVFNIRDLSHHVLNDSEKKILYITAQELSDSNRRKAYDLKNPGKWSGQKISTEN